eukprot:NODE_926_length_3035_cov_0.169959.p3 type:complete len:163 gc:universal NODE_926_length_3035_cov_0.169959:645-1133(+)
MIFFLFFVMALIPKISKSSESPYTVLLNLARHDLEGKFFLFLEGDEASTIRCPESFFINKFAYDACAEIARSITRPSFAVKFLSDERLKTHHTLEIIIKKIDSLEFLEALLPFLVNYELRANYGCDKYYELIRRAPIETLCATYPRAFEFLMSCITDYRSTE